MSTAAAGRTELRRRIASRPAHVRGHAEEHAGGKPHHARSVSISRRTCIASARSASSAASSSASARTAAAAFLRAASMSADRTAADIGVPSRVKMASARDVSSSGRKVIVSATKSSVLQNVRQQSSCRDGRPEQAYSKHFPVGAAALVHDVRPQSRCDRVISSPAQRTRRGKQNQHSSRLA